VAEQNKAFAEFYASCWKDDALKARFMADPKAVLAERGIDMPDKIDVKVVENSDNTVHITMPMAPDGHEDLSMEELSNVAGGWINDPHDHRIDKLNVRAFPSVVK
jgi:hypothetical protein